MEEISWNFLFIYNQSQAPLYVSRFKQQKLSEKQISSAARNNWVRFGNILIPVPTYVTVPEFLCFYTSHSCLWRNLKMSENEDLHLISFCTHLNRKKKKKEEEE